MEKSMDKATLEMAGRAERAGISVVWDRFERQLPQCGFGESGLCCRNCMQGPCRIDPFGEGAQEGICGANRDTMVARGLARAVVGGTASHSSHAKHLAHTLLKAAQGEAPDYPIKDEAKLKGIAQKFGIEHDDDRPVAAIATDVARLALAEFSEKETPLGWAAANVTQARVEAYVKHGVVPTGIDSIIAEMMHRTTYGVDAEPVNLLLGAVKCALADFAGCHLATDLSDILFGTPSPGMTTANLGVLKKEAVNIALHGHNPLLSDMIVQAAADAGLNDRARVAGAAAGINLVGVCCTGNEMMMRHQIPMATSSVSQEMAVLTGVLDAMVVDYQCIMPALAGLCDCFHTRLITTMPIAKISNAVHIPFEEKNALAIGTRIIEEAIKAFGKRDADKIDLPDIRSDAMAGFSSEAIIAALAQVNLEDPLKPLIDNIVAGNIYGICLFAGCNTVKVAQDRNYIEMVKILARQNVLVLATGCAAGAFARQGFMTPAATQEYAGDGLKAVLGAVGEAVGLDGPLPLVLHMGSCVDNTRAADVAVAVANKLGTDLDKLPVVASAPEPVTEKAVAIGTWAVAAGLPTHLGVVPPVLGSPMVTEVLTSTIKDLFGGYFIVETDPVLAADKLIAAMADRRKGLGLEA